MSKKAASSEEAKKLAAKERLKATNYDLLGLHKKDNQELEEFFNTFHKSSEAYDGASLFKKSGGRYQFGNFSGHSAGDKTGPILFDDRKVITHDFHALNRLTPAYVKPEWVKFLEQQTGFFSLLLWAGAVLCFVGFALRGDIDNLYLGIVLAAVTFITGVFSYFQEGKAASLMAQFSKLLAQSIQCQTDLSFRAVEDTWDADGGLNFDPLYLVPGDIVRLKGGDKVPADIRILEADDFKVDNSPLTGEPDALARTPKNTHDGDEPQDVTNIVYFGTDCKEGTATGLVIFTGDDTYIGRIAKLTESTVVDATPINKEIHHFILIVSAVAGILGITFFIVGLALGTDLITNLVFMIGIIVANVPEGLLATVTVSLTLTSKSMAAKAVLVKNMEGVETLGSTTCICSDKTGTLTQNKMTFAELLYDGRIWRTEFVEEDPKAGYASVDADDETFRIFHRALCLNTTAQFVPTDVHGKRDRHDADVFTQPPKPFFRVEKGIPSVAWDTKGDASESSIIKFAQFMHPEAAAARTCTDPDDILAVHDQDLMISSRSAFPAALGGEIPFNSGNKYHLKITENKGNDETPFTVWMKGAPEKITNRCSHHIVNGARVPLTAADRIEIDRLRNELMGKGRRVLAFAKHDMTADQLPVQKSAERNVPVLDPRGVQLEDAHGKPQFQKATVNFYFDQKSKNFPMGEDPTPSIEDPDHARLVGIKLTFLGMAALIDPPRPSVPDAVLSCQRAGIRVVMVTGDHPKTAAAIARMVNIFTEESFKQVGPLEKLRKVEDGEDVGVMEYDPCELDNRGEDISSSRAIVVPGWEFTADTTDEKWRFIFSHDEIVFARTSPAQKLQIVERFQNMESEIVAVTGDGVNDAPALKRADIGVAMGIAGTEVSKTAADMILLDDNFASIVNGVEEGRLIFDNLKKSIAYTLSSNIPEIAPFLIFIVVRVPLPLSTVLILCIDLGTDLVPAISMAWENPESDIMRRPARDSSVDRLVTKKLVSFAYLQIGMVQALAGFFTWFVVMNDYGYPPHVLPGLGANNSWGLQVLFCQLEGGQYRNEAGDVFALAGQDFTAAHAAGYYFWDDAGTGSIVDCAHAARNMDGSSSDRLGLDILVASTYGSFTDGQQVVSLESLQSMHANGWQEYYPWKGVESPFWDSDWTRWNQERSGLPGTGDDVADLLFFSAQLPGVFSVLQAASPSPTGKEVLGDAEVVDALESFIFSQSGITGGDDSFENGVFLQPVFGEAATSTTRQFCYCERDISGQMFVNVASRQMQKEALHHAQCAYFVTIVVVQWADLLICKTRWLSIYHQGMRNPAMNFGLLFETILAAVLCYVPGVDLALGTRPLRLLHWVPAVPFSIVIFLYDEIRKYIMRKTSTPVTQGQQVLMDYGWLARNTYY